MTDFALDHDRDPCVGEFLVVQGGDTLRCPVCGASYDASREAVRASNTEAHMSFWLLKLTKLGMQERKKE